MMRNAVSRRDFLKSAGLTALGVALAACVPAAPAQPGVAATPKVEEKPAEEAAPKVVTISWWNQFSTPICQEMFPRIVGDFEKLYPGIQVDFEISGGPPGGGDYIEVLLSRIAAGNPPDTATLWTPPVQFAARGSLMAIDEMMRDAKWAKPGSFYEKPLRSCQWRGETYGLPSSAGPGCIFINVAQFEEKGISTNREDFPKTWSEVKELSAKFVVWEEGALKRAGLIPWESSWLYPLWSNLNGGKLFDVENERYVLNSEQNVEWLNYWVQWLDDQYGGDIEQLNLYIPGGDVYPQSAFQLQLRSMAQSGSWACTDAEIPFAWEVVRFPYGPSGSKSLTAFWPNWWVIPKGSPHPAEGFLFIEYLCTKGWETWYTAVMDTPAWKDFSPDILTQKLIDAVGLERAKEIHAFFAAYLEDAIDMWNSPIEDFANDTLSSAIDEVLHKTKMPAEALKEAQDLCQAKLEETLKGV